MADVFYLNAIVGLGVVLMSVCRIHLMDASTRPLIVWVMGAKLGVGLALAVLPMLAPESFGWCAIALGAVMLAEGQATSYYWWLGVPRQFKATPCIHRYPWAGIQKE